MNNSLVLVINPGSTSSKIAVFNLQNNVLFEKNIKHSIEELAPFESITDQYEFRKNIILKELEKSDIDIYKVGVIVGRGGMIKPVSSGMYEVNEAMKIDLKKSVEGLHISNLGGLIADDIAKSIGNVRAFIVDPVVVDEFEEIARISGHPKIERKSITHALNQKATAKTHAKNKNKKYTEMSLIVAHLGSGISVGAHHNGRMIDLNQALDGDGPFSPERTGGLPSGQLAKLCFSGKYQHKDIKKMLTGKGGLVAYLGTNNAMEVESRVKAGDKKARLIYEAMAYQTSKEIGAMATVLKGKVDGILITGGVAYDKMFVGWIKEHVEFIAPVYVYPGEDEMDAMAFNGILFLKGEADVMEYK